MLTFLRLITIAIFYNWVAEIKKIISDQNCSETKKMLSDRFVQFRQFPECETKSI